MSVRRRALADAQRAKDKTNPLIRNATSKRGEGLAAHTLVLSRSPEGTLTNVTVFGGEQQPKPGDLQQQQQPQDGRNDNMSKNAKNDKDKDKDKDKQTTTPIVVQHASGFRDIQVVGRDKSSGGVQSLRVVPDGETSTPLLVDLKAGTVTVAEKQGKDVEGKDKAVADSHVANDSMVQGVSLSLTSNQKSVKDMKLNRIAKQLARQNASRESREQGTWKIWILVVLVSFLLYNWYANWS